MLVDLNEASSLQDLDLCIIGAGAAGITLAREFIGQNTRVLLLESGGFEFESETQALYDTEVIGTPYPIESSRLRYFGGTTNHWAGQSKPLDAIDFEERNEIPHSGWPIAYGEYERWLDAAHGICGLGPVDYDPERWEEALGPDPLSRGTIIESKIFQLNSPNVRWGEEYREELVRASNVFVALESNAVELHTSPAGRTIDYLEVGGLDGTRAAIAANRFVIACGGIENARLLLASNSTLPAGIGNEYDNVGRYFLEHPSFGIQRILATSSLRNAGMTWTRTATRRAGRTTTVLRTVGLAAETLRREGLLGQTLFLWGDQPALSEAPPQTPLEGDIRDGAWSGDIDPEFACRALTVVEQSPNPDSRVSLGNHFDPFGKPHARLDWQFTDLDRESLRRGAGLLAAELAKLGLGRSRIAPWTEDDLVPLQPGTGMHHMGTTRMSAQPHDGVVDKDCRVHNFDNLWVAGSSVFPTGGIANPTMNLVALTLRLAAHLGA